MQPNAVSIDSYVDEDGKLHILVNRDVVFHFMGDREEIVQGNDVNLSKNKVTVTGSAYHINPRSSPLINKIVSNKLVLDVIEGKTQTLYARQGRVDYKQIARSKMFNHRLTSGGCKGKKKCK